jgi:hypothetical protein
MFERGDHSRRTRLETPIANTKQARSRDWQLHKFTATLVSFLTFNGTATSANPVDFNTQNCRIAPVSLPSQTTNSYYIRSFGIRVKPRTRSHAWTGGGVALRVTGTCQNHVIWGVNNEIVFDNGERVEFDADAPFYIFTPSPYDFSEKFTNFGSAPILRSQTPLFFNPMESIPIGVWKSSNTWSVNQTSRTSKADSGQMSRLVTSNHRLISAGTQAIYHTQGFILGVVQEQPDGSRIVFSFLYESK